MAGPTDKVSIYNYVELAMTVVMGVMLAAFSCFGRYYVEGQFINAITYGFLIINIIVVMMIFLGEEVGRKQRLCITGTGMIVFFLVAIILVLDVAYLGEHMATVAIIREVIAAAAAVVAGVIYVFDFILNLKGSSP